MGCQPHKFEANRSLLISLPVASNFIMPPGPKRTYGSRHERVALVSSCASGSSPLKRKRLFLEPIPIPNSPIIPSTKRLKSQTSKDFKKLPKQWQRQIAQPQKKLTQLHFNIDKTTLKTCPLCDLTYTKGAPDDEALHRTHCIRVRKGMEWGKEEEREVMKANVQEVISGVGLKGGKQGRIICFKADVGGKIGSKVRRNNFHPP